MSPLRTALHWTVAVTIVLLSSACASYPRTAPLARYNLDAGYRFEKLPHDESVADPGPKNSDDLFVILAFSGGGTRAAALSYGVLRQLRDITFRPDKGDPRSLLDEVDVISSVSGGSFTAAYFALNGSKIFDANGPFHREFLYHPVQRDLFAQAVYYPQNWQHLRSRPEIAAKLYADHVFGEKPFSALRTRPYLILNATDMSTGARFEFTQEQFDLLCGDLGPVPIARGVAASSAFPGLLNSMTIDSFAAKGCGYTGPGSHQGIDWVDLALKGNPDSDRYFAARQLLGYLDPKRTHLHLLDGGLADNIGARSILQGVGSFDRPVERHGNDVILGGWSALNLMNEGKTKKVLIIIVNARTNRTKDWDTKRAGPGTASVIDVSSGIPMGNFSRETIGRIRDLVKQQLPALGGGTPPQLYGLEVSFDDLPSEQERAFFANLGTNFDLDRYEVDCLIDRGASLLRNARFIEPSARTFAAFVKEDLKESTMSGASAPLACTAEEGGRRIGVRHHYLDAGVQIGAVLPGSDDVKDTRFSAGMTFRVTRPHGLGFLMDLGPQTFPIVTDPGGGKTNLGDLRLWSFMAGVGATRLMGRAEATVGVTGGIGLGKFTLSRDAADAYGRLGLFGLRSDASNTWLVKPQASFWYNLSNRWAASATASYIAGRPTVTVGNGTDVPFRRRVDASAFRVGAGLAFKLF